MTTAAELMKYVGKKGRASLMASGGGAILKVNVSVLDARQRFGQLDVLVEPEAGEGSAWMVVDAIDFAEEA